MHEDRIKEQINVALIHPESVSLLHLACLYSVSLMFQFLQTINKLSSFFLDSWVSVSQRAL